MAGDLGDRLTVRKPGPGGWSLLLDVAPLGFEPAEASRVLLDDAKIAATAMTGWGDEVAAKYVRFAVLSRCSKTH